MKDEQEIKPEWIHDGSGGGVDIMYITLTVFIYKLVLDFRDAFL
jgi:hypothetical protein